jgi:2-(1,2-epoxy-1,2-dihydrophenyl)acetyl-CoA isomerase
VTLAGAAGGERDMGGTTVLVDQRDGVATLTLNRPEARNALDFEMREALEGALRDLEADAGVRVLVVTGAGEHFCAGGDVKLMQARRMTAAEGQRRVEAMNRAVRALAGFRAPTIARVDGFAVGAGCNLALACDLVVASDRARFGEVFARIGLVPDGGGTYFLPRRVGLARAKELCFTADVVEAAEAWRMGLVNRVVPAGELVAAATALARRIADGPPRALAAAKSLLDRAVGADLETCLASEARAQGLMVESEDHREGLAAFFEKRAPRFTGR